MTEQQKSALKLLSAMVIIILLPVLFFHFIGENPTKKVSNATGQIAIVNEDTGNKKSDKEYFLGRDVSAILAERPDYEWTVVDRSVAENGLADRKYDAIIYIPSDFSSNILSYDHDRPQKAELKFRVQDRLDAVNKEKVQRELQDAQKTMSKKMSSMYWNVVQDEIQGIRKKFNGIVNKESEFQNAMYNFYKPSSNDLAGEVKSQKDMIDNLEKSINQTKETSKDRNSSVKSSKEELGEFVKNVDQFKTYQQNQTKLLQQAQTQNEKQLTTGLESINKNQGTSTTLFKDQTQGLTSSLNQLDKGVSNSSTAFEKLMNARTTLPGQQLESINGLQSSLIKDYQTDARTQNLNTIQSFLIEERENLAKKPEDDSDPEQDDKENSEDKEDQKHDEEQKHEEDDEEDQPKIDLKEQQDELTQISNELKALSDGLPENTDQNDHKDQSQSPSQQSDQQESSQSSEPAESQESSSNQKQADGVVDLKKQLKDASARLEKVEETLGTKQDEHNEKVKVRLDKLSEKIDDLNSQIEELEKGSRESQEFKNQMKDYIQKKEQNLLKSDITEERKEELKKVFEFDIKVDNADNLLSYYYFLSLFEATAFNSLNPDPSEGFMSNHQSEVKKVLEVSEEESGNWTELNNNMLTSKQDVDKYKKGMETFVDTYSRKVLEKHNAVKDEVGKMSEKAKSVSDLLNNPAKAGTTIESGDSTDGKMVLSLQDNVGKEVFQLSEMLDSLSDDQSGVIKYTNNIHDSVNNVQNKADTLNSNWGKNVNTTKLVRKDVYGILKNGFNGNDNYVHDYLANPLKISGDVPESKAQNVPPVVILVIIMISSLLIGYFSHYYQKAPLLVRGALFGILNIIVGLMISLFGLNIYSLADDQAIMWSIFTIMLLVASSAVIRSTFMLGSIAGGITTAAMILFYVAPLLDLAMPNFSFENPVSTVYMSIQYGTGGLFTLGTGALVLIAIVAMAVPFVVSFAKSRTEESESDHEA
ncbi:type VII secretion protein EsaA [Bacillus sp. CLL-7-23]|uniref:Type VII secretion protein EsaA n=1 Tax=Bacillus changyiensis TaxID=3004103 RepID=A0ABT4X6W3_9BACI|nr:type VII secretion protein EsaA [Bacillus changyiensis]MDA7028037.1 type VII secretion protein EsaA [Bacillus changyiensis]